MIVCLLFGFAGCGGSDGGGESGGGATASSTPPKAAPRPVRDTTSGAPEAKPKTQPKPRPKPKAAPAPPPSDDTRPAYAMIPPQAYELQDASDRRKVRLEGPEDVDPRAFRMTATTRQPARPRGRPRTLPGLQPVPETDVTENGLPERVISEQDNATMVLISAGQYRRGNDRGPETERPEHTVYLSPYYIDETEVTVAQFRRFVEAMKDAGKRVGKPANEDADGDYPVVGVSYRDARQYAEWAGKQLPTEAQWEKAARGPASLTNVWGPGRPLWSKPRTPGQLMPVKAYVNDRSIYGVFDLAGNAREWCRDLWSPTVYQEAAAEPGGVARNWAGPKRPKSRTQQAVRGESDGWSVTAREGVSGAKSGPLVGFRCVVEIDEESFNKPVSSPQTRRRFSDDPD